jgi:hypothetical protein
LGVVDNPTGDHFSFRTLALRQRCFALGAGKRVVDAGTLKKGDTKSCGYLRTDFFFIIRSDRDLVLADSVSF